MWPADKQEQCLQHTQSGFLQLTSNISEQFVQKFMNFYTAVSWHGYLRAEVATAAASCGTWALPAGMFLIVLQKFWCNTKMLSV